MKTLGIDPVTSITAGIHTVTCTECSWEKVYIVPEECGWMLSDILAHLRTYHGAVIPNFIGTTH